MSGELERHDGSGLVEAARRRVGMAPPVSSPAYATPRQQRGQRVDDYPTPDFVLAGVPRPDGTFRLYASKELRRGVLASEDSATRGPCTTLDAAMDNVLIIDGASYGECIARLSQIWANWAANGREIGR